MFNRQILSLYCTHFMIWNCFVFSEKTRLVEERRREEGKRRSGVRGIIYQKKSSTLYSQ